MVAEAITDEMVLTAPRAIQPDWRLHGTPDCKVKSLQKVKRRAKALQDIHVIWVVVGVSCDCIATDVNLGVCTLEYVN